MKAAAELFEEADRNLAEFRDKCADLKACATRLVNELIHEREVHLTCHDKVEAHEKERGNVHK